MSADQITRDMIMITGFDPADAARLTAENMIAGLTPTYVPPKQASIFTDPSLQQGDGTGGPITKESLTSQFADLMGLLGEIFAEAFGVKPNTGTEQKDTSKDGGEKGCCDAHSKEAGQGNKQSKVEKFFNFIKDAFMNFINEIFGSNEVDEVDEDCPVHGKKHDHDHEEDHDHDHDKPIIIEHHHYHHGVPEGARTMEHWLPLEKQKDEPVINLLLSGDSVKA